MSEVRYDTHVHTVYCGHAVDEMVVPAIMAAAATRGLAWLAVTEHLHEPDHLARIDRIRADLMAAERPCPVYVGAEVDADGALEDGSLVVPTDGLAYVIASTHHFPGGQHWWYDQPAWNATERAAVIDRWFAWAARLAANPQVDTLSHPGIMLSRLGLTESFTGAVLDGYRGVFAAAAQHQTMVELNELTTRKLPPAHRETYPALIGAAIEAGCRIVLGSDAHRPEAVAAYDWTLTVAQDCGLELADLGVPRWRADAYPATVNR